MHYHRNVSATLNAPVAIPASKQGAATNFVNRMPGSVVGAKVTMDISHPDTADLTVSLVSPQGTVVPLHNRATSFQPSYSDATFRAIQGQEAQGNWTLQLNSGKNSGVLKSWRIELELDRNVGSVIYKEANVGTTINGKGGATGSLSIPNSKNASFRADNMRIHLDIERTFITDLDIKLKTPWGKSIQLARKSGWTKRGARWTLPGSQVKELNGQNLSGDYTITVAQGTSNEGGMLARWSIEFIHDQDIARVANLDADHATSLLRAGIHTKAALQAAVPLEVSSILALRKHDGAVPTAHKLVPGKTTA